MTHHLITTWILNESPDITISYASIIIIIIIIIILTNFSFKKNNLKW
jgi:hypothetical protein